MDFQEDLVPEVPQVLMNLLFIVHSTVTVILLLIYNNTNVNLHANNLNNLRKKTPAVANLNDFSFD